MNPAATIKPREREAILQSLRAGVAPRIGLQHIQVGRKEEIKAMLQDLEKVKNASATIRFIIGRYGAGKTFFLNLVRALAVEQKFVVAQADVTPDRRLQGSKGQARALYSELLRNLSIRAKPDGGALEAIVSGWISTVDHDVRSTGGDDAAVGQEIERRLKPLAEYVNSFDFMTVIRRYLEGFLSQNTNLQTAALRWLRGEYGTKTEAKSELGVRTIIEDMSIYDYLKLFAQFCVSAGYSGLLVNVDEMGVFSHGLNNAQSRKANYEAILRIVNDCLQGQVSNLAFIFAGTDEFLEDKRRGLFSYEALASRLAANQYAVSGMRDFSGPVLKLSNLTAEDLVVLTHRIRTVFDNPVPARQIISDEQINTFLTRCASTLGSEFFLTPRSIVKDFIGLLSVVEQNPEKSVHEIIGTLNLTPIQSAHSDISQPTEEKDEMTSIRL